MKIDMANFAVRSIRPHLLQHSVEYERKKFQEFLDKQPSEQNDINSWVIVPCHIGSNWTECLTISTSVGGIVTLSLFFRCFRFYQEVA